MYSAGLRIVVKDIAIGAGDLKFDSSSTETDTESPTARHFRDISSELCRLMSRRLVADMGSATRYTLLRNTASIMKI